MTPEWVRSRSGRVTIERFNWDGLRWTKSRDGGSDYVVTYEERTGFPMRDYEHAYGITHIAVMGHGRRDPDDMLLYAGRPSHDWDRVEEPTG